MVKIYYSIKTIKNKIDALDAQKCGFCAIIVVVLLGFKNGTLLTSCCYNNDLFKPTQFL